MNNIREMILPKLLNTSAGLDLEVETAEIKLDEKDILTQFTFKQLIASAEDNDIPFYILGMVISGDENDLPTIHLYDGHALKKYLITKDTDPNTRKNICKVHYFAIKTFDIDRVGKAKEVLPKDAIFRPIDQIFPDECYEYIKVKDPIKKKEHLINLLFKATTLTVFEEDEKQEEEDKKIITNRFQAQGELSQIYHKTLKQVDGAKKTSYILPHDGFVWTSVAAKHDVTVAQYNLGLYLSKAIECSCNPKEAYNLFKMAADKKHQDAAHELSVCLEKGIGCKKDLKLSGEYFGRSGTALRKPDYWISSKV